MVRVRTLAAIALILMFVVEGVPVRAGHEASFNPSYYPQALHIETVEPAAAPGLLTRAAIHAFVGEDLFPGRALPPEISAITSLGSYLVLTFNPTATRFHDRAARCTTAAQVTAVLARAGGRYVVHPYPVLPYHADYLEHADLAERAIRHVHGGSVNGVTVEQATLSIAPQGPLAEDAMKGLWPPARTNWEATLAAIDVGDLLMAQGQGLAGVSVPWLKEGWFHAHLLLAPYVSDPEAKAAIEQLYVRLRTHDYHRSEERITVARDLVARLQQGCERVIVGYTQRRSYVNVNYNDGIENVGFDSQLGLASGIFVRTAKLKAFPWNGELRIGMAKPPQDAWTPFGGFRDPFGRLLWAAVGDPAMLPRPAGMGWIPNRVTVRAIQDQGWGAMFRRFLRRLRGGGAESIDVPPDAVLPTPRSGRLQPVGPGKFASAKIEYRVLASFYHDGTAMTTADALYPFIVAARWVDSPVAGPSRQHLIGLRPLRTEIVTRDLGGDLKLKYDVLVIEGYLDSRNADVGQLTMEMFPWSSLPWHVVALVEAAISDHRDTSLASGPRRLSEVDLVRSPRMTARLAGLLEEFERQAYVPEALRDIVPTQVAQERWRSLRDFMRRYGHLLVTNGPYRLVGWTPHSVKLDVFRDLSYPLGVGSFDQYTRPRRGYITQMHVQEDGLTIYADVERVVKSERTERLVRERLGSNQAGAIDTISPQCRYLVFTEDGRVVKDALARYGKDGVYWADLGHGVGPGAYQIAVAIFLNDNLVNPEIRIVSYTKR